MEAQDLSYFLDGLKDLKGYLIALSVNFNGVDVEKFIFKLNNLPSDPIDFYETLLELRSELCVLVMKYPETEREAYPAVKTIDEIIRNVSFA